MARTGHISTKRIMIDQANKRIVMATGIAAFVCIFSLVAANTLVRQMMYQNRVIGERKDSLRIAQESLAATDQLKASYDAFTSTTRNVLEGNPNGKGDRDGDNAKIVLDALPSRYDFPALATSIEKLVVSHDLKFVSMTGLDDAVAQQENQSSSAPAPLEIPFEFSVSGSYNASQALVQDLERSIRPFQIYALEFTADGDSGAVVLKVSGSTYFQPAKNLNVREEVVQ